MTRPVDRSQEVKRWFLEMHEAPSEQPPVRPPGLALERVENLDLDEYRRLYRRVGDPWQWFAHRVLEDRELLEILGDPAYEIWFPVEQGNPAGLAELDFRGLPDAELRYFGLVPGWIGRGVGRWFLRALIDDALGRPEVTRLWLHTCERDHPGALRFYRRSGFTVYDRDTEGPVPPPHQLLW